MRISDWSSDVCSSDLLARAHAPGRNRKQPGVGLAVDEGKGIAPPVARLGEMHLLGGPALQAREPVDPGGAFLLGKGGLRAGLLEYHQIGRASCRGRVCKYV